MRPITKERRCAYQVHTNPRRSAWPPSARCARPPRRRPGPVYPRSARSCCTPKAQATIGEGAGYQIERPGPARAKTVEAIAKRLGEARCPVLMFGDDVWREAAQAEAVRLAEALEAPVFASRQIFPNFPTRHPLFCGNYPVSKDFEKATGLKPDLIFLVGCQGVHGSVNEPVIMQIGPNPLLMGRHYPLDLAAQCETTETLRGITQALGRVHGPEKAGAWATQRAKVRAYAAMLIEREENLVREHEHDSRCTRGAGGAPGLHPAESTVMVQESSTARTS